MPNNPSGGTPQRSRLRHRVVASLTALLMACAALIGTAAPASAVITPNLCDFAIFVGVRGTNAAAGTGLMHGDRAWKSGGYGDEIAVLRNALGTGDLPYFTESLAFNSNAATAPYHTLVGSGRQMLVNELNYLAKTCPYAPIVLGGHSMGADVILSAIQNGSVSVNLSAAARQAIQAVAVFGDPTYNTGKPYNYLNRVNNGMFPGSSTTDLNAFRYMGYPMGGSGPGYVYKIRSYCNVGDRFCQNNPADGDFTIHNNYQGHMSGAKLWFDYMLTDTN